MLALRGRGTPLDWVAKMPGDAKLNIILIDKV
jgi:hypothetical protein